MGLSTSEGKGLCSLKQEKQTVMIPHYLHAKYEQLSIVRDNNNNLNANQVYNAMIRATKSSQEFIESRSRCRVLKNLKKQNIGTAAVENLTRRLCMYKETNRKFKDSVKDTIVKIVSVPYRS